MPKSDSDHIEMSYKDWLRATLGHQKTNGHHSIDLLLEARSPP